MKLPLLLALCAALFFAMALAQDSPSASVEPSPEASTSPSSSVAPSVEPSPEASTSPSSSVAPSVEPSPAASSSPSATPSAVPPSPSPSAAPTNTILGIIQNDNSFSNLKSALEVSGNDPAVKALVDRLGNVSVTTTFFAPDDTTFTKANGTVTGEFLSYYLVDGSHALADGQLLSTLLVLPSLGNQSQQVLVTKQGDSFHVNGDSVVSKTVEATNGVVYALGQHNLTLPQDLWTVIKNDNSLSTLQNFVNLAGLQAQFQAAQRTAFAPTNAAFQALPAYFTSFVTANTTDSQPVLTKLVNYVLATSVVYLAKLDPNTYQLTTAEGTDLSLVVTANRTFTVSGVNTANVQTPADVLASNGAAHHLDAVLRPADLGFTVANTLVGLGDAVKSYVAELKAQNLLAFLNGAGPFTVFAPATVTANSTATQLQYTIVSGTFKAADLKDGQLLTTLSVTAGSLDGKGQVLKVTKDASGNVFVQGVKVTQADVGVGFASNGVVHLLGGALPLPGTIVDLAKQTPALSTLDSAVVLAGLVSTLSQPGNLTVFAPTNDAFNALPVAVWGYLSSNHSTESNAALSHVLLYHAFTKGVLYNNNGNGNLKPGTLTMAAGGDVTVSDATVANKTVVKVNQATVVLADNAASNGVAHVIDGVLVPGDLNITSFDLLVGLGDTTLIEALNNTNLLTNVTTRSVTIFAPTNGAFNKMEDKSVLSDAKKRSSLTNILLDHVVNQSVSRNQLVDGAKFTTLSGKQVVITTKDNKTFEVNLVGPSAKAAGTIDLAASSATLGSATPANVYSINQVLGEDNKSSGGLTSTEIGLIVAGCIVAVLLAGAAVGGAVWYYKRRHGYEQIDGDSY